MFFLIITTELSDFYNPSNNFPFMFFFTFCGNNPIQWTHIHKYLNFFSFFVQTAPDPVVWIVYNVCYLQRRSYDVSTTCFHEVEGFVCVYVCIS